MRSARCGGHACSGPAWRARGRRRPPTRSTTCTSSLPSGLSPSAPGSTGSAAPLAVRRFAGFTAGRDFHPTPRGLARLWRVSVQLEHVLVPVTFVLVGALSLQQLEGVGHHVEHGVEALDAARRRPGGVEHEAPPEGAGGGPGEPAERADQPHGLGQPGRLAVEDGQGALRREVARPEAGAAGGDDEPGEAVARGRAGPPPPRRCRRRTTIALDDVVNRLRARCSSSAAPERSSRVPSATPSDTVITCARSAMRSSLPEPRSLALPKPLRPAPQRQQLGSVGSRRRGAEAEEGHAVGAGGLRQEAERRGRAGSHGSPRRLDRLELGVGGARGGRRRRAPRRR